MPKKIISKITSRVESVRTTLVEETLPETLSKVKKAGGTVADGASKAGKTAAETFSNVKDNATTVVTSGIKQVSELEWKKELEKLKTLDLPLVTKLRPIDWAAEHKKFWDRDQDEKALEAGSEKGQAKADSSDAAPHALVTGAAVSKETKKKQYELVNGVSLDEATEISSDASEELIPVEVPKKVVDEDELVYTSTSEDFDKAPAILITGKPGYGKGFDSRNQALKAVAEALNGELEKEEDKISLDGSKEKESAPAPKKTAKTASKEPVVTVLGSGEGEVEPLGTEYKKLIRKVAKQAEKNPDVKLYLSGKTFGIGARGTAEKIDGNDVSVFSAKDIKKLLAKIS